MITTRVIVQLVARARSERAASLIEYALLLALVALIALVAVTFLGESTSDSLSEAGSRVVTAN